MTPGKNRTARARARGFTLAELATVVVIVGVLAVVASVVFLRHRRTVRMHEAQDLTAHIREAQERYKSERGLYYKVSTSTDPGNFYPAPNPGAFTTQWGAPCTKCTTPKAWDALGVSAKSPVIFGYATTASVGEQLVASGSSGGSSSSTGGLENNVGGGGRTDSFSDDDSSGHDNSSGGATVGATTPTYTTVAWGDTDGDGIPCTVISYSYSNQLIVTGEGE